MKHKLILVSGWIFVIIQLGYWIYDYYLNDPRMTSHLIIALFLAVALIKMKKTQKELDLIIDVKQ